MKSSGEWYELMRGKGDGGVSFLIYLRRDVSGCVVRVRFVIDADATYKSNR